MTSYDICGTTVYAVSESDHGQLWWEDGSPSLSYGPGLAYHTAEEAVAELRQIAADSGESIRLV